MPNFHAEVSEVFAEMKRAEDAARERQHALFHALRRAGVPGLASAPDDGDDGETGLRAALAGAAHEDLVHIILALTIDKRYQRYTIGQEAVLARAQDGRLSARLVHRCADIIFPMSACLSVCRASMSRLSVRKRKQVPTK
jgi:hypothetical protein